MEVLMDNRYSALFTPWKVGNVEIKNRIVMLPMEGTNLVEWQTTTHANPHVLQYYKDRAQADVGLFIPGAIPVLSIMGRKWSYKHPEVFEQVRPVIEEVHRNGAKIMPQLTCGTGRSLAMPEILKKVYDNKFLMTITKPFTALDEWHVAPDADEPNVWFPEIKARKISRKEIQNYVYAMGQTALRCKEIGADGVEVHAVHEGYLIDQFTMAYTNHRDDEYGGNLENRLRFPCEIVQEIKKVCGQEFPVSLRYSVTSKVKGWSKGAVPGEEFEEWGRDLAESEKAIKILEKAGYDLFNCDNGTYDSWYWAHPPVYMPLNCNLAEAEHIKQFTTKPVICGGRMQPEEAAQSISAGRLDAMGLGRQILCDPEVAKKLKEGRKDDIRPCISCHNACLPMGHYKGAGCIIDMKELRMGRCALNPYTLEENHYRTDKADNPQHIAVIGGGIGGMEAAIEAAKRGHTVDLYEKSDRLGGVFVAAAVPDYKEKDKELLAWYERELKKTTVNVHLNSEVSTLNDIVADHYIIATGAKTRMLKLPGSERAMTALEYLYREKETGDRVAVIGGGLTGCEIAYELALQGKHPVVIEMMDDLIKAKGVCAANSNMLRDLLAFHKVPVYLETTCDRITPDAVEVSTPEGKKTIEADSVIYSIGYISENPFAGNNSENVHVIGDANQVGNLKTVIKSAYDVVQSISYKRK